MGPEERLRWNAYPGCRSASTDGIRPKSSHQASANSGREARLTLRLEGLQAREVKRNSLHPGWANRRRGRGADEPRGLVPRWRTKGRPPAEGNSRSVGRILSI